jgi:hypothetical protein
MNTAFGDLVTNLQGGIRLCQFRKLGAGSFRVSTDQLVLLFLVGTAFSIASGYVNNLPDPEFNTYAITNEGFCAAVLLFSAYFVARFILRRQVAMALTVLILSVSLVFLVMWQFLQLAIIDHISNTSTYWWIYGAYLVWVLSVVFWCIRTIAGVASINVSVSFLVMLFTWATPVWFFADNDSYWYPSYTEDKEDPYKAYRNLDAERILFSQSAMLKHELEALKPERKGVIDVYFVGVGAYARQDVFLKETLFARTLFDRRFDAEGRSITLINHLTTRNEIPLATSTNLEESLRHIGSVMNKDEDILVLYMTSHGSAKHEFSVSFWPLPLNDITPVMLRRYLDDSGIKWRVIMVSACYSGGFIEPIKTAYSAIATAAAADRKSFGCSNENDFTYFGEALLKNQLQEEYSLPVAFSQATEEIAARESKENLTASNPQFVIGAAIAPVLDALTEDLQAMEANGLVKSEY